MTVTLNVKDAPAMNAYVAYPQGEGMHPAIMVFQEAFGVNTHIRDIADRMAKEGYIAIAPEIFHRTAPPGFEVGYTDFSKVMEHYQAITTEGLINDIQATYDWLTAQKNVQKDKIGCIGFCLGGRVAFLANTAVPLAASVSFYGGGIHALADRADQLSGPQLLFWGGKDQHIKQEHIREVTDALRNAGKDFVNVEISYADHAFFNDMRVSYHQQAAKEAWAMVKQFYRNKFGLE